MKTIRYLILTGLMLAGWCREGWAQTGPTTSGTLPPPPAAVVPNDDKDLNRDLRGVPDNIKVLILGFDHTRDKFLAQQAILLAKLKNATTDAERDKIREQLQTNRQAFLDALKDFRTDVKTQLAALKGKISHAEFLKIVDAAHDAATEGSVHVRKGN